MGVMLPGNNAAVHPAHFFEGSEKRIELRFHLGRDAPQNGLRALTREQLDAICTAAHCCIVSMRSNADQDAYVLSESSLFVQPDRLMMKTCGTTRLLDALPLILQATAGIGAVPAKIRYSRASYLAADQQPAPHCSFDLEVAFLQRHFGEMAGGSGAYVMGDALNGLQWHVFVADSGMDVQTNRSAARPPCYTLEVCMTQLCSVKARQFFRGQHFESAARVTHETGIRSLWHCADMDDYVFEPCGYSMNGIYQDGFMTIHVTPEDGFSYASVEFACYDPMVLCNPHALVSKVMDIFGPGQVSVSLSVDMSSEHAWADAFRVPPGYHCTSASLQDLRGGGYVAYFVLGAHLPSTPSTKALLEGAAGVEKEPLGVLHIDSSPSSPRSVLDAAVKPMLPSCSMLSSLSCAADSDNEGGYAGSDSTVPDSLASSMLGLTLGEPAEPAPCKYAEEDSDPSLLYQVLAALDAQSLPSSCTSSLLPYASALIGRHGLDDSFYVYDMGVVIRLYKAWVRAMPRVTPFYAVKCNTDIGLIRTLAALGCGFDCASASELDVVMDQGVGADRIVFANACKRPADIKHAAQRGVALSTFDSVCELQKMARWHPNGNALLRIRADDPDARCQLGNKYGCEPYEVRPLLESAKQLGVHVVGVSFHVGSGATNPQAFSQAIAAARSAWAVAEELGFAMKLLDIGGGFAAGKVGDGGSPEDSPLGKVPDAVNSALDLHFPPSMEVKVISEPGRYFAEAMATYHTMVFGTRMRPAKAGVQDLEAAGKEVALEYWVTDGLYGSMNSVLYDHATLSCGVLPDPAGSTHDNSDKYTSTIFGPTCDGLDTLLRDVLLPKLKVGDWLTWPCMGAYTHVGACDFNGIVATKPPVFYVVSGCV